MSQKFNKGNSLAINDSDESKFTDSDVDNIDRLSESNKSQPPNLTWALNEIKNLKRTQDLSVSRIDKLGRQIFELKVQLRLRHPPVGYSGPRPVRTPLNTALKSIIRKDQKMTENTAFRLNYSSLHDNLEINCVAAIAAFEGVD